MTEDEINESKERMSDDVAMVKYRTYYFTGYDFVDDITNPKFLGEDLFYYKIENLNLLIRNGDEHRLLFIQMAHNYMVPIILEKRSRLKDSIEYIKDKINAHGYEFSTDQIEISLNFNRQIIQWDATIEDYYNMVGKIQAQQNAQQHQEEFIRNEVEYPFIERDINSRMAVMFSLSKLPSGPSYHKKELHDEISLKIKISDLICNILKKNYCEKTIGENDNEEQSQNSEGKGDIMKNFSPKFLKADYIGVRTIHHSKKLDILSKIKISSKDLPNHKIFENIDVRYGIFALLI